MALIDETRWRLSILQPPNGIGKVWTRIPKTPRRGPDVPKRRAHPRPPAPPHVSAFVRTCRERAARRGTGRLPVEPAANVGTSVVALIYGSRPGRARP